ncbi:hypothetical protein [Algoriphagus winogradskyi]|uniref:DUF3828 domain-containing protein n=1 Tax=Algoriphagus winogradskyi TaxID=237017 RepID=A0ABY1NFH2_9BACT|nr:hypothetical protein [Algoriphagus winogradskyi]SMP08285.1 hypothetical protein SAMN06265367_101728 [Algoriphagus winogradskyi]
MTRWIFLGFLLIVGALLISMSRLQVKNDDVPYFLRYDSIAANSNPQIDLEIESVIVPSEQQIEKLLEDYAAIWAHLNELYQHSNPKPNKERFTERFYVNLAENYQEGPPGPIRRTNLSHAIQIKTWSKDGLACNILDSLAVFQYRFPDNTSQTSEAKIAVSLLFQGDNWRLDAIRFIEEKTTTPTP